MSDHTTVSLDAADAVELAELLEFLNDWLHHARRRRQLPALHVRAAAPSTSCAPTWPASPSCSAATADYLDDRRRAGEAADHRRRSPTSSPPCCAACACPTCAPPPPTCWPPPAPNAGTPPKCSASCSKKKSSAATPPPAANAARAAGFPAGKTFDSWRPDDSSIPAPTQQALRTLEWVGRAENLAIAGPSGTGKSHFVEALAHAVIDAGMRVAWFTLEITHHRRRPGQGRRHRSTG